jgi:hypothetical protein
MSALTHGFRRDNLKGGSAVTSPQGHADQARLLRRVPHGFPPEDDRSADQRVRRRVEGTVIASEPAAGETSPKQAAAEPEDPLAPLAE